MSETTTEEKQRGKRRAATRAEVVALATLALAIIDYGAAGDVFVLAFTASLTYAAALRGLDAKFR